MSEQQQDQQSLKQAAAIAAVRDEVRDGMVVGLGTGSTAFFVMQEIARRIREQGLQIRGVPTSLETERLAQAFRIPLTDLADMPDVDLDGADEIDPRGNLTKGAGGAMTREKCVAVAARRLVIVADDSKLVEHLRWPVPIEVLPFALPLVQRALEQRFAGAHVVPRVRNGRAFVTDNGNAILDLALTADRPPPEDLAAELKRLTGVVDHGLFVAMHPAAYVAGAAGVRVLA